MFVEKINLTWKKLILFAILAGVYTAVMAILPFTQDTSFANITFYFEAWILFGILIIMNSQSALDSALKCFVFFLISQPLIYLLQIPFSWQGIEIFKYYPYWFKMTLLTFPMGFVGYYMKKDKWWGLLILTPILLFLGIHYGIFLGKTIYHFPFHLLSCIFCLTTLLFYPLCIFHNKKVKIAGFIISLGIFLVMTVYTVFHLPVYRTTLLVSGGSLEVTFDDSYQANLEDNTFGKVFIVYDEGIEEYMVNAELVKAGKTNLILEDAKGKKMVFELDIKENRYDIKKVEAISENMESEENEVSMNKVTLVVNDKKLEVVLEENEATKAFVEKLNQEDVIVNAKEYGNFEKVGELGFSLPTSDERMVTEAGDIVLYQGDEISLFYHSNTWSYTKLGKVQNISQEELIELLGEKDVTLIFTMK